MKVRYKEDPLAWRKSTLLTLLGLVVLSSLLLWRHAQAASTWVVSLVILSCIALAAWFRPRWFRPYYRFSTWAGFWTSQWAARAVLGLIFVILIVPAAVIMRALGKDPLRVRRLSGAATYWSAAKQRGSLDRLF